MCDCNKIKKGLSEVLFLAQRFSKVQKEITIVYEFENKIDFSCIEWFEVHKTNGAKGLYKVNIDATYEKLL